MQQKTVNCGFGLWILSLDFKFKNIGLVKNSFYRRGGREIVIGKM